MPRLCALPGRADSPVLTGDAARKYHPRVAGRRTFSRGLRGPAWGPLHERLVWISVGEPRGRFRCPASPTHLPQLASLRSAPPGVGIGGSKQLDGDQGRGLRGGCGPRPQA